MQSTNSISHRGITVVHESYHWGHFKAFKNGIFSELHASFLGVLATGLEWLYPPHISPLKRIGYRYQILVNALLDTYVSN